MVFDTGYGRGSEMTLDVITSVLILLLVAFTCVGLVVGLLGEVGAVRGTHCARCGRFATTSRGGSEGICLLCRHDHIAHFLRALRHPAREFAHH